MTWYSQVRKQRRVVGNQMYTSAVTYTNNRFFAQPELKFVFLKTPIRSCVEVGVECGICLKGVPRPVAGDLDTVRPETQHAVCYCTVKELRLQQHRHNLVSFTKKPTYRHMSIVRAPATTNKLKSLNEVRLLQALVAAERWKSSKFMG